MEFNSTPFFYFLHDFFSKFSSHPLFSAIVALYTLILLYAPSFFLQITLSPVINSTGIILLFLLRLGADERSEKEVDSQELRILGYGVDERLNMESSFLESRVLDNKDEWLLVNRDNLAQRSNLALESISIESRFFNYVDQNQTHVEFEPELGLGHASNQTHVEFDPKIGLDHAPYRTHLGFEPESSLKMECNQSNIEFEHGFGMESTSQDDHHKWELLETNFMESSQVSKEEKPTMEMDSKQVDATMMFLEWNIRTPLEIIYEAYEGEEEDDEKSNENDDTFDDKQAIGCEKYPSLSMYYPESETDSSSDGNFSMSENWETHESVLFKWEEEEREELIEISLDHYGKRSIGFCHAEEDNLIEIDIFPKIN
ncbi:uncharacterized protein LOC112523278 [Cynara cardunculus var. scolymus]|uniref:uncharacterized protein LOC112523278 n=1 Tax=Cynara cardunculus var. scolymus TaxID=59895 RepID=UPI000D62D293|nr:uncharacterized protein LOC112523278 [Cynara cardunculus var. scolymus]